MPEKIASQFETQGTHRCWSISSRKACQTLGTQFCAVRHQSFKIVHRSRNSPGIHKNPLGLMDFEIHPLGLILRDQAFWCPKIVAKLDILIWIRVKVRSKRKSAAFYPAMGMDHGYTMIYTSFGYLDSTLIGIFMDKRFAM